MSAHLVGNPSDHGQRAEDSYKALDEFIAARTEVLKVLRLYRQRTRSYEALMRAAERFEAAERAMEDQ
jgi:hypothetical protein